MNIQNTNLNFRAGLTSRMQSEIHAADVRKISQEFAKNGIQTDFKGNKVVALCSLMCYQIIKGLNTNYGLKLGLPNGIFVEDFSKLATECKDSSGMCNFAPTKLYVGKNRIVPGKTLFFNAFEKFNYKNGNHKWDMIDETADIYFEEKTSPTDFFLDMFMHEFAHVIHEENAINKLGGKKFVEDTNNALIPFNLSTFQKKYKHLLGSICNYALYSPFEAVACDLTKRTVAGIDKNSLKVQSNFIKKSPYENKAFLLNLFDFEAKDEQFRLLHRFWNGKLI